MHWTPKSLKWLLRFYPPLFFQRIWVNKIYDDFTGIDITIRRSLININYNKSIFGGTIYAATDPFYTVLIHQALKQQGFTKTIAWLKSGSISYKKPGMTDLKYSIRISSEEMRLFATTLANEGRLIQEFTIEIFDKNQELCAVATNEIYIRDLTFNYINTSV